MVCMHPFTVCMHPYMVWCAYACIPCVGVHVHVVRVMSHLAAMIFGSMLATVKRRPREGARAADGGAWRLSHSTCRFSKDTFLLPCAAPPGPSSSSSPMRPAMSGARSFMLVLIACSSSVRQPSPCDSTYARASAVAPISMAIGGYVLTWGMARGEKTRDIKSISSHRGGRHPSRTAIQPRFAVGHHRSQRCVGQVIAPVPPVARGGERLCGVAAAEGEPAAPRLARGDQLMEFAVDEEACVESKGPPCYGQSGAGWAGFTSARGCPKSSSLGLLASANWPGEERLASRTGLVFDIGRGRSAAPSLGSGRCRGSRARSTGRAARR